MLMKENNVEHMEDGLRYRRKKRKLNDVKRYDEIISQSNFGKNVNNDTNTEEIVPTKSKRFKFFKNKENENSKKIDKMLNDIKLEEFVTEKNMSKKEVKNTVYKINNNNNLKENNVNNLVTSTNDVRSKNNQANIHTNNIIPDKIKIDKNNNYSVNLLQKITDPELPPPSISDNKKNYLQESERINLAVNKYEENFYEVYVNFLADKLINCCRKNSRSIKDIKVSTVFKLDKLSVDFNKYSPKTTLINLELFLIDTIINCKEILHNYIEVEYPNIGNILLCYYSNLMNLKTAKSLIPIINSNLEKQSDVVIIKLTNAENLANQNKLLTISQYQKSYKDNYHKTSRLEKNIKKGKQISSEYDNIVYNEIFNIFSISVDFKKILYFDFNIIQEIFLNNAFYVDSQLKKSDAYNKIIKYANEEAVEINHKKIKMMKIKQELNTGYRSLFSKICDNAIYYVNTSDLILNFLEN